VAELAEAQRRAEERLSRLEETVAALAEAQRRTEERLSRLEETVAALAEAQRRTEQTLQALIERTDRMQVQLDQMRGEYLELRYERHAGGYFGRLLRRVRVVRPDELDDLLEAGVASGTLAEDDAQDVRLADLIVRGRRPGEDRDTYLVVEVSAVIDPLDVERAVRRAGLLGRVYPALPVVAGARLAPEAQRLAELNRVWTVTDGRAETQDGS
jgi:septal ring factor EnvC (AmiA/AmiB activator)